MSKWIYRKTEPAHVRGICLMCEKRPQKKKSRRRGYGTLCKQCEDERWNMSWSLGGDKPYKKYKGSICERCSFKAIDTCQLDVHHKDGDHHNNDPNNLETLCANCHRLEHFAQIEPRTVH